MNNSLETKIEAILFWKGEPVRVTDISSLLKITPEEIKTGIESLKKTLEGRGITIVENGDEVMLYTSPEQSDLIKELTKEELTREISKAALEVLSLVVYRGPISKRDIDYIRGVNSSYIIRNLMIRGLIERVDTKDARSFVYGPTFELLAHLGITKKEDLADFESVQKDIADFMSAEQGNTEQKNG